MEAEEGLEKIQHALRICEKYAQCYFDHKDNLSRYFKAKPVLEWKFESTMIFCNLNAFLNRLKIIQVQKQWEIK